MAYVIEPLREIYAWKAWYLQTWKYTEYCTIVQFGPKFQTTSMWILWLKWLKTELESIRNLQFSPERTVKNIYRRFCQMRHYLKTNRKTGSEQKPGLSCMCTLGQESLRVFLPGCLRTGQSQTGLWHVSSAGQTQLEHSPFLQAGWPSQKMLQPAKKKVWKDLDVAPDSSQFKAIVVVF